MQKRGVLVTTTMTTILGLTAVTGIAVASGGGAATQPDLYWPDSMGTHTAPNLGEGHMCTSASECAWVGAFSFPNLSIGDAALSMEHIDGLDVLKVDGIDSTLDNGVMQILPGTKIMHTYLMLPNFSRSHRGATLKTTQFGIVDGVADQEFSSLTITNVGRRLQVDGDWSPIGARSYEIQIFNGTELVTAQNGLRTGRMFLPVTDILGEDCEIEPPHKVTGELASAQAFTIPGRGRFVGDNFAILPENDDREPTAQTRIEMLAKDTGPLYLAQQFSSEGWVDK